MHGEVYRSSYTAVVTPGSTINHIVVSSAAPSSIDDIRMLNQKLSYSGLEPSRKQRKENMYMHTRLQIL